MPDRLSCPQCGTILRIRDRSLIGRRVGCPECNAKLKVESIDGKEPSFTVRLDPNPAIAGKRLTTPNRPQPVLPATENDTFGSRFRKSLSSPFTAVTLVTFAVTGLLAVIALNPKLRFMAPRQPVNVGGPLANEPPIRSAPENSSAVEVVQESVAESVSISPIDDRISTAIEEEVLLSALQPSNLDQPISWPPTAASDTVSAAPAPANESPIRIDVESKLAQKILSYKQPKVSRRILIDALQEQVGIPIRYNTQELGEARLNETVTFELMDTTLGEVLQHVANSASWKIAVEETGLRLTGHHE